MQAILILLGLFHLANGAVMLVAPAEWYHLVPGVTETGPANFHFIRDIGLAFIAAGAGLIVGARRHGWAVLAPSAIFLGGHAGLHLVGIAAHGAASTEALRDIATIVIPGFLPAYALWRRRGQTPERSTA